MFQFQQIINNQPCPASNGNVWDLVNPANETVIQQVPFGNGADARMAIDAAAAAFPAWAKLTPYERSAYLMKAVSWIQANDTELAKITTEESGKPYSESLAEWRSAPNYLIWAAEEAKRVYGRTIPTRIATRRILVTHQPLGVVASITAWNFPVYNVVRTLSSAIAVGNTIVIRPSEFTPRSAMLLAQAFVEAGTPPGVVNVVNGDPNQMGQVFLADARVRKLAFTGSTRVGKLLMDGASKSVTRLALELGGNAPLIVFPDVPNLKALVQQAIATKYRNCGQVCVSPQRFYVHQKIAEEFLDYAVQFTNQQVLGNGLDAQTTVGPLINQKQRQRVADLVSASVAQGAQVVAGGHIPEHLPKGYFYHPTVVTGLADSSPLLNEEIFGPILPIVAFSDPEEVLAKANATEYGLAAFVHTSHLNTALLMSERLEYGMVCVNDWLPATPESPFGGVKASGMGRESGVEGVLEYTEAKAVFFGGVA
jgi:acyl-CoA reductase-like NAD-dependent aldehyde dehydrogenase